MLSTISFWIAVILLLDVVVGLLGLDHWQRLIPFINVRRLILVEAAAAAVLLAIYFWL